MLVSKSNQSGSKVTDTFESITNHEVSLAVASWVRQYANGAYGGEVVSMGFDYNKRLWIAVCERYSNFGLFNLTFGD